MDIYASDEEKGEAIKRWWTENGRSVVIGCALGGLIIFAGRYWLNQQKLQTEQASFVYQQVLQSLQTKESAKADELTQKLLSDFSGTPYAVFSAFEMAEQAHQNDDDDTALIYLKWINDNASLVAHQELALLRQTKILIDQQKYEQALDLIGQSELNSFSSVFSELKGDIAIAKNDRDSARHDYQNALDSLNENDPRQILLRIKLDDLAIEKNDA